MKQILINVDEEFKKLVKIKAIENNTTMKDIIIEAVEEWIIKNEKPPK